MLLTMAKSGQGNNTGESEVEAWASMLRSLKDRQSSSTQPTKQEL